MRERDIMSLDGEELSVAVAELIMGWTRHPTGRRVIDEDTPYHSYDWFWMPKKFEQNVKYWRPLPDYHINLDDAYRILKELSDRYVNVIITNRVYSVEPTKWNVALYSHGDPEDESDLVEVEDERLPVAIGFKWQQI